MARNTFFFSPRKQFLGQWKEDRNLSGVCVIGDGMGSGGRAFLAEGIGCVKTMKQEKYGCLKNQKQYCWFTVRTIESVVLIKGERRGRQTIADQSLQTQAAIGSRKADHIKVREVGTENWYPHTPSRETATTQLMLITIMEDSERSVVRSLRKTTNPDFNTLSSTFFFDLFIIFIYCCTMRHVGSQFPDQGSNPRPLHPEGRFLTTGPPGKSPHF